MATLPDLPTQDVGVMAYYNINDAGSLEFDVTDALTISSIASYRQYDNGILANYIISQNSRPDRTVNVRVKSDGWIVVWVEDDTNYYGLNYSGSDLVRNLMDLITDWTRGGGDDGLGNSPYSRVISNIVNTLDPNVDYDVSDVSLYTYAYPNATNFNVITGSIFTFSYPSTITRQFESMGGFSPTYQNIYDNTKYQNISLNGLQLADPEDIYSVDNISEGLTPNPSTSYSIEAGNNSNEANNAVVAILSA